MGSNKKIMGLIFSNMHDDCISDLTKSRTMGSVLFGGRYRLIDFPLSGMTNSGIAEVGVITKSNYQSLLDHVGSGREWDLARKNGGLHLLPPYSHVSNGVYRGRLEAIHGVWNFIKYSDADYIVFADCNVVANFDYSKIVDAHIESGADITVAYGKNNISFEESQQSTVFGLNDDGRVTDVLLNPHISGDCNVYLNIAVISKEFLNNIIIETSPKGLISFEKDVLQAKVNDYKIIGYEFDGYYSKIYSMFSYYKANMALLNSENLDNLFKEKYPIYTKVRDNPPAKFAIGSNAKKSLIADGCIIEGTVENSVLFRGVKVGKGAVVKNCILMQDTVIGENVSIDCVISDKNVTVTDGRTLTGSEKYPLFIGKHAEI